MSIQQAINQAIKEAMIAKDKATLQTLRMVTASFKQIEVDQRIEITDEIALRELGRLVKQRRESIKQFEAGNRPDLAQQEEAEIAIIQRFLPQQLTPEEVEAIIHQTLAESGLPKAPSSMGALMAQLKTRLEGQTEMGKVSQMLTQILKS